jgi:hypothetical protein
VADWHWELFQDDLLDGHPDAARAETERLANEIAVRESMVFLGGLRLYGPGARIGGGTESRGLLMLTFSDGRAWRADRGGSSELVRLNQQRRGVVNRVADTHDYDDSIPHVQEHLDRFLRVFDEVRRTHADRPSEEVRRALAAGFDEAGLTVWNEVVDDAARQIASRPG